MVVVVHDEDKRSRGRHGGFTELAVARATEAHVLPSSWKSIKQDTPSVLDILIAALGDLDWQGRQTNVLNFA